MADTTYWYAYLATPTSDEVQEFILNQFVELWRDYDDARGSVPTGDLTEISYHELTTDPVHAIRKIYSSLGITGFDERQVGAKIERFLANRMPGYQRNSFKPLPRDLHELISSRWSSFAETLGYNWDHEEEPPRGRASHVTH